ncbi:MAG TPA: DUF1844 domain-containing protein [Candidatus Polarisedimenticolia bacterium]|nr:DUF1844 domain-containing protein [Candidatus Polarisedimenticolia bacterium]
MPDHDEKQEPVIKVTDRRAFTSEGKRRSLEEDAASGPEPAEHRIRGEGFEMKPRPEAGTGGPAAGAPPVEFNSFILSLASTAFIHLGEMEDPISKQVEVNLEGARQMIDLIDMLHAKTRGNLQPEEEEFIAGILYELKMRFAQKASAR